MASLASLVSLGSASTSSSGHFEGTLSPARTVSLSRNVCGSRKIWGGKRWRRVGVCVYSVKTDYIAEQGASVSLDSTYRGSKDNDPDLVVRAAPKPVLKSGPNFNSANSVTWDKSKLSGDSIDGQLNGDEEERNKVIESLGEVLEKAEKLETGKQVSVPVNKPPPNTSTGQSNGNPVNSMAGKKHKTFKSVWKKGNPVASVQKVVLESPKIEKVDKEEQNIEGSAKVVSESAAHLRPPQPPSMVQPKLQAKPSVAPPPPVIKKPVILKDVGAGPKAPVTDETNSAAKTKERKPILVDKFASKKPVVDPLIAQAVLAPPKPGKGPMTGRFRDVRKKSGASGGPRRRMFNDVEIHDEETSALNVSIPGAATGRKGRKWSKASRKAARLQAAKEAAPVKVEILEVGEEGMSTEELAHNLVISEGEIFGYLYSMGIKPDGVQTLDKSMVKMICKEYEVEVIDAVPVRVEEMAKKKEILDEDDLESLEDRPPVLTIMGHVDHGKTTLLDYIRKSKVYVKLNHLDSPF